MSGFVDRGRIQAFFRHVQFLAGVENTSEGNTGLSNVLSLAGATGCSASTLTRWQNSECRPRSDTVAGLIKIYDCPKLGAWLHESLYPPNDDQIRLLFFLNFWTQSQVKVENLNNCIRWIFDRWRPTTRFETFSSSQGGNLQSWSIPALSSPSEAFAVKTDLVGSVNQSNPSSIATFLIALAGENIIPNEPRIDTPYSYKSKLSTFSVDLFGICMLIERQYQAWGDKAYATNDSTIDIAWKLTSFISRPETFKHSENPKVESHQIRRLATLFTRSGIKIHNTEIFRKNLVTIRNIIQKMLREVGTDCNEISLLSNRNITNFPQLPLP